MTSEHIVVDADEWPNLIIPSAYEARASKLRQNCDNINNSSEDWEMLQPESSNSSGADAMIPDHTSFEIIEENESEGASLEGRPGNEIDQHQLQKHCNGMRHSVSSPNFSSVMLGSTSTVLLSNSASLGMVAEEEDDDNFSLVAGPASVLSSASTTTTMTISFRDMAASSIMTTQSEPGCTTSLTVATRQKQRSTIRSKYVVVPSPMGKGSGMRRCSKSTGDLQNLCLNFEGNHNTYDIGSSSTGACGDDSNEDHHHDAMEFYNRKLLGSSSRINGLKLRPDEAKRRDMILHKKAHQRQQQKSPLK